MITRVEQIGDCTLALGDCLEILPTLGKVDAIVSDPPYGMNYNTDSKRFSRKKSPYWGCIDKTLVSGERPIHGDNLTFDPTSFIDRPCILWGANHYADQLPPSGGWLVWDKRRGAEAMAEKGWPLSEAELAWTNVRGSVRVFRYLWFGILRDGEKGQHHHPTQKPVALMQWCIGFVPNARTILDPFAGSGTTGVACVELGRKFVGIELDEKYFDIACRRIEQAVKKQECKLPGFSAKAKAVQVALPL